MSNHSVAFHEEFRSESRTNPKRILSIDGGGIRGVIPAAILAHIEQITEHKISELFDMVAGTSTGGILALALTLPNGDGRAKYTAAELVSLYQQHGKDIFGDLRWHHGAVGPRYSGQGLERIAREYLGDGMLSGALTELFITAYDLHARGPHFFTRNDARDPRHHHDFRLVDAAMATAAAPTYFPAVPAQIDQFPLGLVDGGVFANNPALLAYAEATRVFPDCNSFVLLSLGTGSGEPPIPVSQASAWGFKGWGEHLLDIVFDGTSDSVEWALQRILHSPDSDTNYYRLQPPLAGTPIPLDGFGDDTMNTLLGATHAYLELPTTKQVLRDLCPRIMPPTSA